jgi:hypothetical protein
MSAHRLLAYLLEELLSPLGVSVFTDFPVMSDPPEADILLLRCEQPEWTPEQRALLPDGVRDSQATHILLEFKYTESVNEDVFCQALGYDTFYRRAKQLSRKDVQTFVLSAKTPHRATLRQFGYETMTESGVYYSENVLLRRLPLLVLNKLQDTPHNGFVKSFASRRQAKKAAVETLRRIDWRAFPPKLYWLISGIWRQLAMLTKEEEVAMHLGLTPKQVMKLAKEWEELVLPLMPVEVLFESFTPEQIMTHFKLTPEEIITHLTPEEIITHLTPEEIITHLKPEEIIAHLTPEERLAGLGAEERLAGLGAEERLAGLGAEEIEAYMRKLKEEQK